MPNSSESGTRVQGTPTTSYTRLTKAELVAIINGNVMNHPLSFEELYRCAIAVVASWCHRVEKCHFACTESVKSSLDALHHIYKNL